MLKAFWFVIAACATTLAMPLGRQTLVLGKMQSPSHAKTPRASTRIAVAGRCLIPTHELKCVTHRSSSRNEFGIVGNARGASKALGWEAGQSGYSYLNGLILSFLSLLPVLDGSNRIQSTQQGWYIGSTGAWHAGRAPEAITGTHQVLAQ
jgi:hypothetical protein